MSQIFRIAITKSTSRVAYLFVFLLAGSSLLRHLTRCYGRVALHLVDDDQNKLSALEMELQDIRLDDRVQIRCFGDQGEAFSNSDLVLIIGGYHQSQKRTRNEYLIENARLMKRHAIDLSGKMKPGAMVIVVANPVNLNCMVLDWEISKTASNVTKARIFGLSLLDQIRAEGWISRNLKVDRGQVSNVVAIGNHSSKVSLDAGNLAIKGEKRSLIRFDEEKMLNFVRGRGQEIIDTGGHNSVGSAAFALLNLLDALIGNTDEVLSCVSAPMKEGDVWLSRAVRTSELLNGTSTIQIDLPLSDPAARALIESQNELRQDVEFLRLNGYFG